ncbi:MAG TPA: amidohydrolase family protein [Candidatus Lokiarchaeia archaeon]|nr:amidohydrolase family protein [Candidatus Lokiarchaeia archaeon]
MVSTDDLLAKMDGTGIDKIALMANMCGPLPYIKPSLEKVGRFLLTHSAFRGTGRKEFDKFTPDGDFILPSGVVKILRDPDNQIVFDTIGQYPNKFLGWIFVNPKGNNDQLEEFNKWVNSSNVIGVKAHPFWHRFAPIELLPVAEQVAPLGKPMLLHLGFDNHGDYRALLKAVPELKLVLAHAAFPYYSTIWKQIKDLPNVFVDLSATSYVDETITKQAVRFLGVDKCFFGTDGPFGSPAPGGGFDLGMIKKRIERLFPDKTVQAKLMGDNFSKLIGL